MNWKPPAYIRKAVTEAIDIVETNHYSLPKGRARLRNALAKFFSPSFGRQLDAETEIVVTAGANEGMYAFEAAFLQQDEEVILFEPFFDQYLCNTTFQSGVPVYVPMTPPVNAKAGVSSSSEWKVDIAKLRAAITPKTKIIVVNTPHNPIGKVFDADELRAIGKVAEEFNLLICADEVYDSLTFDKEHIRIAALDEFWGRTITIGSAGKSFSATGWRVGWCIGPAHLVKPTLAATTRIVYAVNSPLQEATAVGFEDAHKEKFFSTQIEEYTERRAILCQALDELGLPYTLPDGAYFILVQNERIKLPKDFVIPDLVKDRPKDWHISWFLAQTIGVVAIPASDFYCTEHKAIGANFTRLSFCKDTDTLRAAGKRLMDLKQYLE